MNAMAGGLGEAMWQIPKGEVEFESVSESVSATSTSNMPHLELKRKRSERHFQTYTAMHIAVAIT